MSGDTKLVIGLVVFVVIAIIVYLSGNGWTKARKNLESNYSSLTREINVMNAYSGDTLFHYVGECYISDDGKGLTTLIYYEGRRAKKADWTGNGYIFQAIER